MIKSDLTKDDHILRLDKVFHFIDENLHANLMLEDVAKVASFSPYHFHRIFKTLTGETLNKYINRRKLEVSAFDVLHQSESISGIADKYGFCDVTSYSRAFKKLYGVSPTVFAKKTPNRFDKIGQNANSQSNYLPKIIQLSEWIKANATIEVKRTSKLDIAYVTSIGQENMESAYEFLMKWADKKGIMGESLKFVVIYHDTLQTTSMEKLRLSVGILLEKRVDYKNEVSFRSISDKNKYAVGKFNITKNELEKSWVALFLWVLEKGLKIGDGFGFEIHHSNFLNQTNEKQNVHLYFPLS